MRRNIYSIMIIAFAMIAVVMMSSCKEKAATEGAVTGPAPAAAPAVTTPEETSKPPPEETKAPGEPEKSGVDISELIGKFLFFQAAVPEKTIGDVNGDGVRDFVVKAGSQWPIFLLYSGKVENNGAPITTITGVKSTDSSVSIGGDLNADGYADILIGDAGAMNDKNETIGAVFFFSGKRFSVTSGNIPKTLFVKDADAVVYGTYAGVNFGSLVLAIGDVDGDGNDDFMAGVKNYGRVYIFSGKKLISGAIKNSGDRISAIEGSWSFGTSLAKAGDINKDGKDEIMISDKATEPGAIPAVYIFRTEDLKQNITANSAYRIIEDVLIATKILGVEKKEFEYANFFGLSMSAAGDLDHDGYDDIIIGASFPFGDNDNRLLRKGSAFVFNGKKIATSSQRIPSTEAWYSFGGDPDDYFAWSVAGDVDVDGSGSNDVIIGSPYHQRDKVDDITTAKGCVYIYYDLGKAETGPKIECGDAYGNWFGYIVAPLGNAKKGEKAAYVVSAPGALGNKGEVSVFRPDKNEVVKVQNPVPNEGIQFGSSISSAVR